MVCRLLVAVASLAAEDWLWGIWASAATHGLSSCGSRLWRTGSTAVAQGLGCSAACGILPDQGSNLRLLHRQEDSFPLTHQGSPIQPFFICDSGLAELNCRNPSDLAKVDRFKSWHSLRQVM